MPITPQNFWNFSLDLYDREGVAGACLDLQDEFGLDVNLILFCYWFGDQHGSVDPKLMQATVQLSKDWRSEIVQPLRDVRHRLKADAKRSKAIDGLREDIKAAELGAEKLQQEQIATLAREWTDDVDLLKSQVAIKENIQRLLDQLQIAQTPRMSSLLNVISEKMESEEKRVEIRS